MPPRRKPPERLDEEQIRDKMLRGINDEAAVFLYDQATLALASRDQADFMTALQLRDAAQWTVAIDDMQEELRRQVASSEPDDKRIAAIIKNKQAAEDARRRILDGLLLTPQAGPRRQSPSARMTAAARRQTTPGRHLTKRLRAVMTRERIDAARNHEKRRL